MHELSKPQASEWLRIGEAADYLGVHPATLRRWSDEGTVACIRTPGGRRRFSKAALDQFLRSLATSPPPQAPVPSPTATLLGALPPSPMVSSRTAASVHEQPWFSQLSSEGRANLRGQGQKLMSTFMHYISRGDANGRFLEEGKRLAANYARLFITNGLSIGEVVRSFLLVRRVIIDSLHEVGHAHTPLDPESWRLYERTQDFLDQVLISMVDVYHSAAADKS